MPEFKLFRPWLSTTIYLAFAFSTMYTIIYLYEVGSSTNLNPTAMNRPTDANQAGRLSGAFALVDWILGFISWFSPITLVKPFIALILAPLDPMVYTIADLMVLRPLSWIVTLITVDYAISRIPTISSSG